jgi:hypothetical protein
VSVDHHQHHRRRVDHHHLVDHHDHDAGRLDHHHDDPPALLADRLCRSEAVDRRPKADPTP